MPEPSPSARPNTWPAGLTTRTVAPDREQSAHARCASRSTRAALPPRKAYADDPPHEREARSDLRDAYRRRMRLNSLRSKNSRRSDHVLQGRIGQATVDAVKRQLAPARVVVGDLKAVRGVPHPLSLPVGARPEDGCARRHRRTN